MNVFLVNMNHLFFLKLWPLQLLKVCEDELFFDAHCIASFFFSLANLMMPWSIFVTLELFEMMNKSRLSQWNCVSSLLMENIRIADLIQSEIKTAAFHLTAYHSKYEFAQYDSNLKGSQLSNGRFKMWNLLKG